MSSTDITYIFTKASAILFLALVLFLAPNWVAIPIILLLAARFACFLLPSKGKRRESTNPGGGNVLLVMDMQDALLGRDGIYPDADLFVENVNAAIRDAREKGWETLYIRQEFPLWDTFFCFLVMGGRLLSKGGGAGFVPGLDVEGEEFIKHQQDAFTSPRLRDYLRQKNTACVYLVGIDASACVYKTAVGAKNQGYQTAVIRSGVLARDREALEKAFDHYQAKGISLV